jgi:Uma2 family endonuclease
VPLRFPEAAEMPESPVHLILRTFLYDLLRYFLGEEHSVGSEQFVYWAPTDPRRCLSPDLFVKLGAKERYVPSWKCWERGAPDLAVEVVSPSDSADTTWEAKLARYRELGVTELLRFDREAPEGERLTAWDRVEGDFIARVISADTTPCLALGLTWVVCPVDVVSVGLRLAARDGNLIASRLEDERAGREAERAGREAERAAREAEKATREAAEARVRELEERLAAHK